MESGKFNPATLLVDMGIRSLKSVHYNLNEAALMQHAISRKEGTLGLGGSILVETVFSWPGTGFLLNDAIFRRDIPLLQGVILVLAMFFVVLNLIVDIAQSLIDPRMNRS